MTKLHGKTKILFDIAVVVVVLLILNIAASYFLGAYKARDYQERHLQKILMPESTVLTNKYEFSFLATSASSSYVYESRLTEQALVTFYKEQLYKAGWERRAVKKQKNEVLHWDRLNHHIDLIFDRANFYENKRFYSLTIRWGAFDSRHE